MAEISKEAQNKINQTIKDISTKEFYRGISTGKIVIANMIKTKLENMKDNYENYDKDAIIKYISDIIKFCDTTLKTTPEVETQIAKIMQSDQKESKDYE